MESDRSHRSVFVGNIPYDATEERLKEIFSTVGVVRNFKLVYDRETGKPKGYGFCEYNDQETANSAISNLNSYEINGRPIRVDSAANDRLNEEIKPSGMMMEPEQMYSSEESNQSADLQNQAPGKPNASTSAAQCAAEEIPSMIAQHVQSMSPELKYQTARQFQLAVLSNPAEMRRLMLESPPLALALVNLCTSVGMLDVPTASKLLYRGTQAMPIIPPGNEGLPPQIPGFPPIVPPPQIPDVPPFLPPPHNGQPFHPQPPLPPPIAVHDPRVRGDPRAQAPDVGYPPHMVPPPPNHIPPPQLPPQVPIDPRLRNQPPPVQPPPQVPIDPRRGPPAHYPPNGGVPPPFMGHPPPVPPPQPVPAPHLPPHQPNQAGSGEQSDSEKADLIRQILSLDDTQIAALPEEQRQSILQIKQQLQPGG